MSPDEVDLFLALHGHTPATNCTSVCIEAELHDA